MKSVSDPVLGLLGVWLYSGRNMLDLDSTAGRSIRGTAIINMGVSPKVRTVEVAHHWGAIVVGCKLAAVDLEGGLFWSFHRPLHP